MRAFLAAISLFLCLAACRSAQEALLDPARSGEIEQQVRGMMDDIARELSRSGPGGWMDFFVDGPEFYMLSDGKLVFPDVEAARTATDALATDVSGMELAWSSVRIDPVADGLALIAASYQETITMTSGTETRFGGYFSGVAVETVRGWRLRTLHWSSPVPAPE